MRESGALVRREVEGADGTFRRGRHEGGEGGEGSADAPGGLPVLRVVGGDGEADIDASLEAAVGSEELDPGGFVWVLSREGETAVVHATFELCSVWPAECEVPLAQVIFERLNGEGTFLTFLLMQLLQLSCYPPRVLVRARAHCPTPNGAV